MMKRVLPALLVVLSVFVVGKLALHWVGYQQQMQASNQAEDVQALPQDDTLSVEASDVLPESSMPTKNHQVAWGALWIPTAEAAVSMAIAEEAQAALSNEDLQALQEARAKIARKEKLLNQHMDELKQADDKIKQRIAKLEALESNIQDLLDQEKSIKSKKIKRLTTIYEGMKADKAAVVISQMELITVVKMFSRMNEKQVGKILSFLRPKQAMMISQALTKGIGSLNQ